MLLTLVYSIFFGKTTNLQKNERIIIISHKKYSELLICDYKNCSENEEGFHPPQSKHSSFLIDITESLLLTYQKSKGIIQSLLLYHKPYHTSKIFSNNKWITMIKQQIHYY